MSFASLFAPRIETYADLKFAAVSGLQRRRALRSGRHRLGSLALGGIAALMAGAFVLSYIAATYEAGRNLGPHSILQRGGPATLDTRVSQ